MYAIRSYYECGDFSQEEICSICSDNKRVKAQICVVSDPRDVGAMERTGEYNGLYHVLHGTISPNNNKGPDDIRLKDVITSYSIHYTKLYEWSRVP